MRLTSLHAAALFAIAWLASLFSAPVFAQQLSQEPTLVKGQVVDEAGQPAAGVQVYVPTITFDEDYITTNVPATDGCGA